MEPDFTGWASKNDIQCSDGVIIRKDAFKHNDTLKVPLVWQHQHTGVKNILGHGILENHPDGVRIKGFFNDTEDGKHAKSMVAHGDVESLSIFATGVKKKGVNVTHGDIKEVSLVIAGANEGAKIDYVYIQHGDELDVVEGEFVLETGEAIEHALKPEDFARTTDEDTDEDDVEHADRTVQEIYNEMTDEQRGVVAFVADQLRKNLKPVPDKIEHADTDPAKKTDEDDSSDDSKPEDQDDSSDEDDADESDTSDEAKDKKKDQSKDKSSEDENTNDDSVEHSNKEGTPMGFNQFEKAAGGAGTDTLQHSGLGGTAIKTKQDYNNLVHSIFGPIVESRGSGMGMLSDMVLQHAGGDTYGITNIDVLFPDFKATSASPEVISRQPEWVQKVIGGARKAPTAKIKTLVADLTDDEARARGYITGTEKKEEVIPFLKRTTGPTTVYKKQKLDRDDIIDITDFDVVAWLKWEIRFMLDEEIARAVLIGDGRSVLSEDKIQDPAGSTNGNGIRSILHDHPLYTITVNLPANVEPDVAIDEIVRARVDYRGTGNPVYFTTDRNLVDLLLLKDRMGRRLYDTKASLATVLGVSEIVTVEAFEQEVDLFGIIVNMGDYTIGANRGGEVSFFDDFDIDFNQFKYLMETRISGALHKPKSAIVIKRQTGTAVVTTSMSPSYNGETHVISIPSVAGVDYLIDDEVKTGNVTITKNTTVTARAKSGYYIPAGTNRSWTYNF